ncbi:hypothetical protein AYO20_02697 [Fonsecaea nubica]|uniref:histone acetyltransferase n=1 Tax=Fonsecaea nubica TaxID=856822 RepID=A0A178D933_9EURO|nr:hypothetical protein AYO20_02697 [Fonsecaea nubica]OAL37864.1 hypothetical protein AYO20_02697 [Fonsecaea nubica]
MSSLPSRLSAALPVGLELRVYHLSTPPTRAPALFAPLKGHDEDATFCESHFLAVSSQNEDKEILAYAVEVLVFTTQSLVTIFVSKADSSGFTSRLNQPKNYPSPISTVTSTFIQFLVEPRLTSPRVVVSLFARSQNQYLFPGSSENAGKHILDDRRLIKWWCRVLDIVMRQPRDDVVATAHLLVPGCDKSGVKTFFPPSSQTDSSSDPKWVDSYPVSLLVPDPLLPPRHVVPRLPDDPKARFLEDLDEFVDENGEWRGVKTLDQFWETMSYRQECSAGRVVGFVWLVFSRGQTEHTTLNELEKTSQTENLASQPTKPSLITPANSQQQHETCNTGTGSPTASILKMNAELNSPPSSSPIHPDSESKAIENGQNADHSAPVPEVAESSMLRTTRATRGELLIDATQYQALMEHLLRTDFAHEAPAAQATRSWIDKALELSRAASFGHPIRGRATPVLAPPTAPDVASSAQVNVLTGVRKKRKADTLDNGTTTNTTTTPNNSSAPGITQAVASTTANTLPNNLITKKPKT